MRRRRVGKRLGWAVQVDEEEQVGEADRVEVVVVVVVVEVVERDAVLARVVSLLLVVLRDELVLLERV